MITLGVITLGVLGFGKLHCLLVKATRLSVKAVLELELVQLDIDYCQT